MPDNTFAKYLTSLKAKKKLVVVHLTANEFRNPKEAGQHPLFALEGQIKSVGVDFFILDMSDDTGDDIEVDAITEVVAIPFSGVAYIYPVESGDISQKP